MKQFSHSRRIPTATLFALFFCASLTVTFADLSPATAQDWGDEVTVDMGDDDEPQEDPADNQEARAEPQTNEVSARRPARAQDHQRQIRDATRRQLQTGAGTIHIYQLVEEMIDEVISDIADLNPRAVAPAAFRTMNLTPNLSAQFGEFVESTLISAISSHTDITIKRCIACHSLRSRVDENDWVVSRGMVAHDDLVQEAERLGATAFLDSRLSYFPGANIVAMQIEFIRADDGAVLWTETYRSDATTANILRTGDRVESRAERVLELERRIDERPYYGHQLMIGGAYIPYDSPQGGISGATLGYRLYEKFGPELKYLFGIGAEGFGNFGDNALLGSFVYATFQTELTARNLNRPTYRTGPTIGAFFAGTEGNSVVAEWGFDAVLQFRLGAGASVFYFLPTEYAGYDLGGFGMKGRVSFNW